MPDLTGQTPLSVSTATLEIAYEAHGKVDDPVVVLLHGFPDDVRAWDRVVGTVVAAGCRVIVPYLRGYGLTRFRDPDTQRVGQQAALGQDVIDLLDGLGVARAPPSPGSTGVVALPASRRSTLRSASRGYLPSGVTTFTTPRSARAYCRPQGSVTVGTSGTSTRRAAFAA